VRIGRPAANDDAYVILLHAFLAVVLRLTGGQMALALTGAVKSKRPPTVGRLPRGGAAARNPVDILLAAGSGFEYPKTCATQRPWRETVAISKSNQSRPSALASVCVNCPVCRHARRTQRGFAFWLVRTVERKVCLFGRAYERAFGRPPHEPNRP
jgi:hypothetical protein